MDRDAVAPVNEAQEQGRAGAQHLPRCLKGMRRGALSARILVRGSSSGSKEARSS